MGRSEAAPRRRAAPPLGFAGVRRPASALTILAALGARRVRLLVPARGAPPAALRPARRQARERAGSARRALSGGCRAVAAATLGEVAGASTARPPPGTASARRSLASRARRRWRRPISSGDAGAARAALHALLANQIARIDILKSGQSVRQRRQRPGDRARARHAARRRELRALGAGRRQLHQRRPSRSPAQRSCCSPATALPRAKAPRAGSPERSQDRSPRESPRAERSNMKVRSTQTYSIPGSVYPSGTLRIVLLIPRRGSRCAGSAPRRRASATLGRVGERIYEEEAGSAVRARDAAPHRSRRALSARRRRARRRATRAAIVGFFAAHIHVVRVRVDVVEPAARSASSTTSAARTCWRRCTARCAAPASSSAASRSRSRTTPAT